MVDIKSNQLRSVSLEHQAAAGRIVGVFMSGVQFYNPKKDEKNGRRLIGLDMRSVPVAGNDDLIIYCK